jgi:hypothetical protein
VAAHSGELHLGDILEACGVDLSSLLLLRHTYTATEHGLRAGSSLTTDSVRAYTRHQDVKGSKVPSKPPALWLTFMADGGRRSRFVCAYENRGEVAVEGTASDRFFDLHESDLLSTLRGRLVIQWGKDTINWAKSGSSAARYPVVEIADPEIVEFPGYDRLLLNFDQLLSVVEDSRYARWQTALAAVQGIYLIADSTNGHLYVGKADGHDRILGRWRAYAHDGHGGNKALRDLAERDEDHARHFRFSILRVFGPQATAMEVNEAESHFKRALLSMQPLGMNWG